MSAPCPCPCDARALAAIVPSVPLASISLDLVLEPTLMMPFGYVIDDVGLLVGNITPERISHMPAELSVSTAINIVHIYPSFAAHKAIQFPFASHVVNWYSVPE
eukprot:3977453-Pyramimonas_sp.AAC.1